MTYCEIIGFLAADRKGLIFSSKHLSGTTADADGGLGRGIGCTNETVNTSAKQSFDPALGGHQDG